MRSCSLLTGLLALLLSSAASADHPAEGSATLRQLIAEATGQNLEIQQATKDLEAKRAEVRARFGAYLPEVSIAGGAQSTKLDEARSSGPALYGVAEWNIYRGGVDRAAYERARLESEFLERQTEIVKARVSRAVAQAYFDLLFLDESVALKETALAMNGEQMKLARAKMSSGFTSNADVIEFELREATLRSDLQELGRERGAQTLGLTALLGRKDATATIGIRGHLQRDPFRPKSAALLDQVATNNPEVLAAQQALRASEIDKSVARAGYLPTLSLEAQFGRILTDDAVYKQNNNFRGSLLFKVPLFSGLSTKNSVRAATLLTERQDLELSRQKIGARVALENIVARMSSLQDRLDLEERTLSRSEEYYKLTLGEYKRGVKNSPDMVGAAERLIEARLRNLQFRKDFQLAKLELFSLTGSSFPDSQDL
jgi:outer membrane protein